MYEDSDPNEVRADASRAEWANERDAELVAERFAAQLDGISGDDPDGAHGEADRVLLAAVHPDVAEAYRRLVRRCEWWATA